MNFGIEWTTGDLKKLKRLWQPERGEWSTLRRAFPDRSDKAIARAAFKLGLRKHPTTTFDPCPEMVALTTRRKAAGISNFALAPVIGWACWTLHRWDRGDGHPGAYARACYHEALDRMGAP